MMIELFYSHVRLEDFTKQQQVATKLFTTFKEKKFLYWAVCSILMQVPKDSPDHMSLRLALGMLEKGLTDLKNPEVVRLYIILLQKMKNYEKIVQVLQGPLGTLLDHLPYDRKQMIAENAKLCKEKSMIALSNGMYSHLLDKYNCDEWGWWQGWLETFETLKGSELNQIETSLDGKEPIKIEIVTTLDAAKKFIKSIQERESKNKIQSRGPFLIELLLASHSEDLTELMSLMTQYLVRFGTKPICFADCKMIIEKCHLKKHQGEVLVSNISKHLEKESGENHILFDINIEKLKRHLRIFEDTHEKIISSLLSRFFKVLASRKEISEQKIGTKLGDDYILLAVHHSLDLFDKSKDAMHLQNGIVALEFGLTKNADNFQFKILLCRLYCKLGCVDKASEVFYKLDTKHIQWETLSYLVLYDILRSPGFTEKSILLLDKISNWVREHYRDTPELMLMAYDKESYSKVEDFLAFKSKMDHSLQVTLVSIHSILFRFTKNSSLITESITFLDREVKNVISMDPYQINDDVQCPTLYETKKKIVDQVVYPEPCHWSLKERVDDMKVYQLIPVLMQASVALYSLNERKKPEKKKGQDVTWVATDVLIKEKQTLFGNKFEQWQDLVKNCKTCNFDVLIASLNVVSAIYPYLLAVKSGQHANEDEIAKQVNLLIEIVEKSFSKATPILWTPDMGYTFYYLGFQLVLLNSMMPAWNSILKKEKVILKKLKDILVTQLTNLKKKMDTIQNTLFIQQEVHVKEFFAQDFLQFYESIEKNVTNDISNSIQRIHRVISDLLLELDTFRI